MCRRRAHDRAFSCARISHEQQRTGFSRRENSANTLSVDLDNLRAEFGFFEVLKVPARLIAVASQASDIGAVAGRSLETYRSRYSRAQPGGIDAKALYAEGGEGIPKQPKGAIGVALPFGKTLHDLSDDGLIRALEVKDQNVDQPGQSC
jgi:hypothetical protein